MARRSHPPVGQPHRKRRARAPASAGYARAPFRDGGSHWLGRPFVRHLQRLAEAPAQPVTEAPLAPAAAQGLRHQQPPSPNCAGSGGAARTLLAGP